MAGFQHLIGPKTYLDKRDVGRHLQKQYKHQYGSKNALRTLLGSAMKDGA